MSVYDQIKDLAYSYLTLDLPIIPLCSHNHRGNSDQHKEKCKSPGKAPVLKNWSQHKTTTEDELDSWFAGNKYLNIGLVLGQTENWNIVGVDIDGELGEKTFQEVSKQQAVPDTWEFTSGNGRRLLYLLPDNLATQKCKVTWKEGHEELAFLAQGQQTVLPPSMHASGKQYTWIDGHSPFECDIAMAPNWIIEKIKVQVPNGPEQLPSFFGEPLSTPVVMEEYAKDVSEGNRSNTLARMVGSLCAKRTLTKEVIKQATMQQNLLFCHPPLDESEIDAMVESIYESEMQKHQKMLQRQRRRQELHPAALAELFNAKLNNEGIFWRYNETKGKMYRTTNLQGPWVMLSNEAALAEIHSFIVDQDASMAVMSKCNEIYSQMVILSTNKNGDGHELNLGDNPYSDYIAIRNGVFDWKNLKLLPWEPNYLHTSMIEATWNSAAKETEAWKLWDEALHSWIDEEDTIKFLQEYIGYALLPSNKMRTSVFLHGEGANGKSLFIDVVQSLFESSTIVTQPVALSSRFGTSCIIDKLLVVCSDIDATYLDRTGVLKQLIAGDRVRAEYKNGKEFDFVPVCKLLFSANKLPKSADKSHGWYSRLQFVLFPHEFEPNQQYYANIMSTMRSDEGRSALLAWAIEGLQRLEINGKWTISQGMIKSKDEYRRDNDNVLAFAESMLEDSPIKDGGYKTSLVAKAVYLTYKEWCEDVGMKSASQQEFMARMGSRYEKKSLRWKVGSGWKSQLSFVDVQFQEDSDFGAKTTYEFHYNAAVR